jgi:hypothetical protein
MGYREKYLEDVEVLEKVDNLTNNKVVFDESVYDDLYKESLRLSNIKENLIKITKIYNDKPDGRSFIISPKTTGINIIIFF